MNTLLVGENPATAPHHRRDLPELAALAEPLRSHWAKLLEVLGPEVPNTPAPWLQESPRSPGIGALLSFLFWFKCSSPISQSNSATPGIKSIKTRVPQLGALLQPFFGWEGSPTKIDYRKTKTGSNLFKPLKSGGPSLGFLFGLEPAGVRRCGGVEMKPLQITSVRFPLCLFFRRSFWLESSYLSIERHKAIYTVCRGVNSNQENRTVQAIETMVCSSLPEFPIVALLENEFGGKQRVWTCFGQSR